MQKIVQLWSKNEKVVAGIMSGTSVDGVDVAITKIKGNHLETEVELLAFECFNYTKKIRSEIFKLFEKSSSSSESVCYMNFLLGNVFADCVLKTIKKYHIPLEKLDLIGSHGQTIYHMPKEINTHGYPIKSTLQIGEGAVIAHKTGVVTVSDFRVADMVAMGEGAPLVPYVDYLLYNSTKNTVALQNIGGIGNVTVITPNCEESEITAFDTGPGNVIIDYITNYVTQGKQHYDKDGLLAAQGTPCMEIVAELLEHNYLKLAPPKTTGRELYNSHFCREVIRKCKVYSLSNQDMIATATAFTAHSIYNAYSNFVPTQVDTLIVSGGGSYNTTLMKMLKTLFKKTYIITQEDVGFHSNAKEAVAFAVLANETLSGNGNNVPSATGANCKKVLGKISL